MGILTALNRFAGLVPPLVYVVVAGMLLSGFLFNSWRLDSANKALGEARVAVDQAKGINDHNKETVAQLSATNTACLDGRRTDENKFIAARAGWNAERTQLNERATEVRTHEIEVYRDPTCADLAQLDISAACPSLANGLRVRADRLNRIRDSLARGPG